MRAMMTTAIKSKIMMVMLIAKIIAVATISIKMIIITFVIRRIISKIKIIIVRMKRNVRMQAHRVLHKA